MSKNKRKYTVYMHISPNNKRYIGITQQEPENRWKSGNGYYKNEHFTNAIRKYGWNNFKHEILFEGLTKDEAEQKEIELITYYKSNQREFGYNIANGGNTAGSMSEETKRKISESHKGMTYGESTREKLKIAKRRENLSEETLKKMSEAAKARDITPWLGRHLSEETKRKISESRKGKKMPEEQKRKMINTQSIPVVQLDKNNVFISRYPSAKIAGEITKVFNGDICRVCKGKRETAGGYIWMYESDYNESLNYNK